MLRYRIVYYLEKNLSATICLGAAVSITLKKVCVLPLAKVPYCISVCFARSSADSIGVNIRSTVRKAARLAV